MAGPIHYAPLEFSSLDDPTVMIDKLNELSRQIQQTKSDHQEKLDNHEKRIRELED